MRCKKCNKIIDTIKENYCCNCGTKVEKIEIKKDLNSKNIAMFLDGPYAVRYGLISAKYVKVKKQRQCEDCNCKILEGTLSLTSSKRTYKGNTRIWRCLNCSNEILNIAMEDNNHERILSEMYDEF